MVDPLALFASGIQSVVGDLSTMITWAVGILVTLFALEIVIIALTGHGYWPSFGSGRKGQDGEYDEYAKRRYKYELFKRTYETRQERGRGPSNKEVDNEMGHGSDWGRL